MYIRDSMIQISGKTMRAIWHIQIVRWGGLIFNSYGRMYKQRANSVAAKHQKDSCIWSNEWQHWSDGEVFHDIHFIKRHGYEDVMDAPAKKKGRPTGIHNTNYYSFDRVEPYSSTFRPIVELDWEPANDTTVKMSLIEWRKELVPSEIHQREKMAKIKAAKPLGKTGKTHIMAKIRCLNTGVIYPTLRAAGKANGISIDAVRRSCNSGTPVHMPAKLQFERVKETV